MTRIDAVNAISHTVYPGQRVIASGGNDPRKLLVTYLQPQLQDPMRGNKYVNNQSEDSSFIVTPLFLLLPAAGILVLKYRQYKKIDYILLSLIMCSVLFLAHLFIPHLGILTKILLLHYVPHDRLMIGLGLLAGLLLGYISKLYMSDSLHLTKRVKISLLIYIGIYSLAALWAGYLTHKLYIDFIPSKKLILLMGVICIGAMSLWLMRYVRTGLVLLAVFSMVSVYAINPLYRGLGVAYSNKVEQAIVSISDKNATWAAAQNISIENLPQMAGRPAITGVLAYPNADFWRQYSEQPNDHIYNRYAHTILTTNNTSSLTLVGPDVYAISADCKRKIAQKVDYVVSATPLIGSCYKLLETIPYPNMTFYIYKQ
jgi:hypothetical protein